MYFGQIKQEKIVFFVILDKKILSRPEKETFKKVQKFEIFQKG